MTAYQQGPTPPGQQPAGQQPQPGQGWPAPPPDQPGADDRPGGGRWRDFLMFRTMITPGLITIVWLIGFVLVTIWAVATVFLTEDILAGLLVGLLVWLVGNLYLRVVLELMIVLFRIYGRLGDVEKNTRPR